MGFKRLAPAEPEEELLPEEDWMEHAVYEVLHSTHAEHRWSRDAALTAVESAFKRHLGAGFNLRQYETMVDANQFYRSYLRPYRLDERKARNNFNTKGRVGITRHNLREQWCRKQRVPPRECESILQFEALARK